MDIQKMKIEEVVEKINLLYRESQLRELTEEEKILQGELRERYLSNVRRNFKRQLEGIEFKNKKKG